MIEHGTCILQHTAAINDLQRENSELKERLIELDSNLRRNQLVFEGIKEGRYESAPELYNKVCNEITRISGQDAYKIPINFVERLGTIGNPRGVVAHFACISDCETILKHKHLLTKGVYVKQNYPPEVEERRSKLLPILKKAKSLPTYNRKSK